MPIQRVIDPPPLPARPVDGHKGTFGRVLVVGGNDAMIGAPVLAGTAALRMGAGLVQIAVPKSILSAALSITPELIGGGFGLFDDYLAQAEKADAIVIGPGFGQRFRVRVRLLSMLRTDQRTNKPTVLDADALNLIAKQQCWPEYFKAPAVLTPHPGEMSRLARLFGRDTGPNDEQGRIDIASQAARAFTQVIVLKGHRTVVADGERVYVNTTGNSALSKAGTGDVLSGILGTLLAQKMDRFAAACAAVHLHGLAGEIAGKKLGLRSVLARDVIDALPQAIGEYELKFG